MSDNIKKNIDVIIEDLKAAKAVLHAAKSEGLSHFDTAAAARIGRALEKNHPEAAAHIIGHPHFHHGDDHEINYAALAFVMSDYV